MMTNEIRWLPAEKYSRMKFYLKKIIWHVILKMMTNEIRWLPAEKYSRMKFYLKKIIWHVI
jgi:hypothetical protein